MSKINICFITDDYYAMPTGVTLTSLYRNKSEDSQYEVFILSHNIDKKNIDKLLELNKEDFKVSVIKIPDAQKYDKITSNRPYVSRAALFKFDIPVILENIDKVLYLDSDILVQKDLGELYSTELENYYAAVIKDVISIMKPEHLESLMLKTPYFNSGVMLLNLKKLRKDNVAEKLIDYRTSTDNIFVDQDAFNVIFGEDVKYVSVKYNLIYEFMSWLTVEQLENFYEEKFCEKPKDNCKNTVILHLGGPSKPWKKFQRLTPLYLKYLLASPFKSNTAGVLRVCLKQFMSRIILILRLNFQ